MPLSSEKRAELMKMFYGFALGAVVFGVIIPEIVFRIARMIILGSIRDIQRRDEKDVVSTQDLRQDTGFRRVFLISALEKMECRGDINHLYKDERWYLPD